MEVDKVKAIYFEAGRLARALEARAKLDEGFKGMGHNIEVEAAAGEWQARKKLERAVQEWLASKE